jgi:hypothetical protein
MRGAGQDSIDEHIDPVEVSPSNILPATEQVVVSPVLQQPINESQMRE